MLFNDSENDDIKTPVILLDFNDYLSKYHNIIFGKLRCPKIL